MSYLKTYVAGRKFALQTTNRNFDTLLFLTLENVNTPNEYKIYNDLTSVEVDYTGTSEVLKAAKIFFSDLLSGEIYSKKFMVAKTGGFSPATSGTYLTNEVTVSNFTATDSTYSMSVDGNSSDITIDCSGVTTLQDLVDLMKAAQSDVDITINETNKILFTSKTTGSTSIVSEPTATGSGTDISQYINGGTTTNGQNATGETLAMTYSRLRTYGSIADFFALSLDNNIGDDVTYKEQIEDLIDAVESTEDYGSLFFIESSDEGIIDSTVTEDLASYCFNKKSIFTSVSYRDTTRIDEYISVALASLTLAYQIGSYTLYYKQIPTATPTILSNDPALEKIRIGMDKRANFYMIEARRNAFKMASVGRENWEIDGGGGILYIESNIQDSLLNAFQTEKKITADDRGIALVESILNANFTDFDELGLIKNTDGAPLYKFSVVLQEPDTFLITTDYIYAKTVLQIINNYYLPLSSDEFNTNRIIGG